MKGEDSLVARIARLYAGAPLPRDAIGIGDDAAVVRAQGGGVLLVSTDLFVEGVHFDPRYVPPTFVGHKALAVAASDIGAMGGVPSGCLLSLAVPPRASGRLVEAVLAGFSGEASRSGFRCWGAICPVRPRLWFWMSSFLAGPRAAGPSCAVARSRRTGST